jgi:ketosteroid isomerase-like protein
MAAENAEVLRRILEATARKDYAAVLPDLDPALEIDDTDIPESTGSDTFVDWLARWDAAWDDWWIEDLVVRSAGDSRAIGLFRMVVVGKGSGVEVSRDDAVVGSFRNGKAVKLGYYNDQAVALEAVGLRA